MLRPYRSLPQVQHIFKTKEEDNKAVLALDEDDDGENKIWGSVPIPTVGDTKLSYHQMLASQRHFLFIPHPPLLPLLHQSAPAVLESPSQPRARSL